jgi:hypothetical protein
MKRARRTPMLWAHFATPRRTLDRDVLCALCREPGSQAASVIIA